MNDDMLKKLDEVKAAIEDACRDESRETYREFLSELQSHCEVALTALDEDEEREKGSDGR